MSIFENFADIEKKILNESDEEDEFEIMTCLFEKFINQYSNIKYNKSNIKMFCLDGTRLFKLNNLFWTQGLKEMDESDDLDNPNIQDKLEKVKKVIANTNLLIELFPNQEFIDKSTNQILWEYLESNENKFKILSKDILDFYQEINQDMKDLNESITNVSNSLEKATVILQANLISSQIKEKLKNVKSNFKWFSDSLDSLNNIVSESSYTDDNINLVIQTLETVINKFSPYIKV